MKSKIVFLNEMGFKFVVPAFLESRNDIAHKPALESLG